MEEKYTDPFNGNKKRSFKPTNSKKIGLKLNRFYKILLGIFIIGIGFWFLFNNLNQTVNDDLIFFNHINNSIDEAENQKLSDDSFDYLFDEATNNDMSFRLSETCMKCDKELYDPINRKCFYCNNSFDGWGFICGNDDIKEEQGNYSISCSSYKPDFNNPEEALAILNSPMDLFSSSLQNARDSIMKTKDSTTVKFLGFDDYDMNIHNHKVWDVSEIVFCSRSCADDYCWGYH